MVTVPVNEGYVVRDLYRYTAEFITGLGNIIAGLEDMSLHQRNTKSFIDHASSSESQRDHEPTFIHTVEYTAHTIRAGYDGSAPPASVHDEAVTEQGCIVVISNQDGFRI